MTGAASFTIRSATAGDVPHVLPMVRAICDLHRDWDGKRFPIRDDVDRLYAEWLPKRAADPRSVFLVAERLIDSVPTLCGFLVGSIEQNIRIYTLTEYAYLHDLWVEPEHRGLGIGGAIIAEAVARFAQMGVQQMRGETALANDAARTLLARHGFRVGTIEMILDQPGQNE
ncbi:MAG: GNAT family N-acetyltransferase [Phycisphaerales bacterium]|nr:GNAT family N-acetyltransferase [Phycisphaerales bacterium]